jgi:hypothetical protein
MSKLFFDHLISFEEIEIIIKKKASSKEEKEELWGLIDEIVNHKVFSNILDKLPPEHHEEFMALFHKCPHDEVVIFDYLKSKSGRDVEKELQAELKGISADLINELKLIDEVSNETKISKK